MKKHTQKQDILQYLKRHRKGITPLEALKMFGCFRLGARIYDLTKDGHSIKTEIVNLDGKHFANYKLVK